MNEIALSHARWRKSSHSNHEANCVEVAFIKDKAVAVRDSKNPDGGALVLSPDEWSVFLKGWIAGKRR